MQQINRHTISVFKWDTSFDNKDTAFDLQQRISDWSKHKLQREIGRVFDQVCPSEQLWKIQSLEIDLGQIDYNNLEAELTQAIGESLNKKLTDLIVSDSTSGNPLIEVLSEEASRLNVLENFLLNGIKQQTSLGSSMSQLVSVQLQTGFSEIIDLIRRIGGGNENVRKRIVWQFSEPDLIEIIRGLEPNNHNQIVDFSTEFTKIQSKKSIVKGDAKDFKKNLWLWILNYLLVEKGSLFNRIDFMRSSIKQMANHYNVSYKDLLMLIEDAINAIRQKDMIRPDFIIALKILTDENKINAVLHDQVNVVNYWQSFEALLRNESLRRSGAKKKELNELFISLYREDKRRLAEMIRSVGTSKPLWESLTRDLTHESCEILIKVQASEKSGDLIRSIYFIEQLCRNGSIKIEKKLIWTIAITFVAEYKNLVTTGNHFFKYCIAELGKKDNRGSQSVALSFINAEVSWKSKTVSHADIFNRITTLANKEISFDKNVLRETSFNKLLQRIDLLADQRWDVEKLEDTKEIIARNIYSEPVLALKYLANYPDKVKLEKIFRIVLDVNLARILVRNSELELYQAVLKLAELLGQFNVDKKNRSISRFLEADVWLTSACLIIRFPFLKPSQLLWNLLKELSRKLSVQQFNALKIFCELTHNHRPDLINGITQFNTRLSIQEDGLKQFFETKKLVRLTKLSGNPAQLGEFLNMNFSNPSFVNFRKAAHSDRNVVLNYFVRGSGQLMNTLIDKFEKIIKSRPGEGIRLDVKNRLSDLYWKVLFGYNNHNGNSKAFERAFSEAVLYHFSLSEKKQGIPVFKDPVTETGNKYVVLKNGLSLARSEVFQCIAVMLDEATVELAFKGKNISLKELLDLGLTVKPAEITRLLTRIEITDKRIEGLKDSVAFDEFILWITNSRAVWLRDRAEVLVFLYELTSEYASSILAQKLHKNYWQVFWEMVKANRWSVQEASKLAKDTFQKIAIENRISRNEIIAEIKKKNKRLTPGLKEILANCLTEITRVENNTQPSASDTLMKIEKNGLLDNVIQQIVFTQQLPVWLNHKEPEEVLNEIIDHYFFRFYALVKYKTFTELQLSWLHQVLDFRVLMSGVGKLNKMKSSDLEILTKFYYSLGHIAIKGITTRELQYLVFRKMILALTHNNWKVMAIGNIWNEINWDVCVKRGIDKKQFMDSITRAKAIFPPALQMAWENTKDKNEHVSISEKKVPKELLTSLPLQKKNEAAVKTGIKIKNAGLVLLNSFIPMLLERLGIITGERKFVSPDARSEAVHYLQYVVTGLCETEESFLPLNKVLCGMPLSEPVHGSIHISEENKKLISGLIKAAIGFWPSAGDSSIQGFRGNWLVRDGILKEQDDRWELSVEKRVYDLLIHKSPFSFSIIKFPWMLKPLHVNWPY